MIILCSLKAKYVDMNAVGGVENKIETNITGDHPLYWWPSANNCQAITVCNIRVNNVYIPLFIVLIHGYHFCDYFYKCVLIKISVYFLSFFLKKNVKYVM